MHTAFAGAKEKSGGREGGGGVITTSLGVNGADVGPASLEQNNTLKGVVAQWDLFSSPGDVSSIAARGAGMLSRWHGEGK